MSSIQVEASPQAGNFNWRKRLRQDSSGSESERKAQKLSWNYITLESESPLPSEEDTESVYSLQAHETEYCRDTSDTDWSSYSVDAGDILMQVEYEVDSDYDKSEKFVFGDDAGSSSGTEGVVETAVVVATLWDSDLALLADTEDSKSGYSTDSELGHADYWTCVRCKNKNNNPLFRYCEKCYKKRKDFFPPRPKGKKKKRDASRKSDGHKSASSTTADESINTTLQRGFSQDSGVATSLSQESIDLMDLGTIQIPENLLKQTKASLAPILDLSKPGSSRDVTDNGSLVSVDLVRTDQKVVLYTRNAKSENNEQNEEIAIKDIVKTHAKDFSEKNEMLDCKASTSNSEENVKNNFLCITCMTETRDAIFMHSGILHICCCYKCAMRVWTECKRCPMCNQKISNVRKFCFA